MYFFFDLRFQEHQYFAIVRFKPFDGLLTGEKLPVDPEKGTTTEVGLELRKIFIDNHLSTGKVSHKNNLVFRKEVSHLIHVQRYELCSFSCHDPAVRGAIFLYQLHDAALQKMLLQSSYFI